jgi:hypothetical protein
VVALPVIFRLSAASVLSSTFCRAQLLLLFYLPLLLHLQIRRVDSTSYARFCGIASPHPPQLYILFLCALSACILLRVCLRNCGSEVRPAAALKPWRPGPRPDPRLFHRLACLRCNCARWTSRNALCAFQELVRRIKGLAATVLLSFEWLWPSTACHWLRSLPFAPLDTRL